MPKNKKKSCKKEKIDVKRSDDIPCLKSLSIHDKEVSVQPKNTKKSCEEEEVDVETLDDIPTLTSLQIKARISHRFRSKAKKKSCKEEIDVEILNDTSELPSLMEQDEKKSINMNESIRRREIKEAIKALSVYFGKDVSEAELLILTRESIIEKEQLLRGKKSELRKLQRKAVKRGLAVKGFLLFSDGPGILCTRSVYETVPQTDLGIAYFLWFSDGPGILCARSVLETAA